MEYLSTSNAEAGPYSREGTGHLEQSSHPMSNPKISMALGDLDFILEHLEDVRAVFTLENAEIKTVPARAFPPQDSKWPAGSVS
jgi:hypothetical protein